ncbi:hypothetical protein CSUI_007345, partial [Cystoisospora suis]
CLGSLVCFLLRSSELRRAKKREREKLACIFPRK